MSPATAQGLVVELLPEGGELLGGAPRGAFSGMRGRRHPRAALHPAFTASVSEQNQRSPLLRSIFVTSYQLPPGRW